MADPFHRHGALPERGSVAKSFPGYLSSEAPSLLSNNTFAPTDLPSYSSDFLQRDKPLGSLGVTAGSSLYDPLVDTYPSQRQAGAISLGPGPYGVYDSVGSRVRADPSIGATAGTSLYGNMELTYRSQRQDGAMTSVTPGVYGVDAVGVSVRAEPGLGVTEGASIRGYSSPLGSQSLLGQRHEVLLSSGTSVHPIETSKEISAPPRSGDGLPVLRGESNILYVGGLPTDCTRREVGHLFRPFIGFKEIKVVHKEPRRSGHKAMVLCFVEFADPQCALTAMDALQGYKFDDKKPDSLPLRIQFAHFPFHLPSDSKEKRIGTPR